MLDIPDGSVVRLPVKVKFYNCIVVAKEIPVLRLVSQRQPVGLICAPRSGRDGKGLHPVRNLRVRSGEVVGELL